MNKKNNISGYRLHKERILFSGRDIIRTIKYPLIPLEEDEASKDFFEKLQEAIIHDDLKVRGDLNLNDYLQYSAKNNPIYTLFDFWVDSLKYGVIWMPKSSELIDFLYSYYKIKSPVDIIWQKASEKITGYFDKLKFKDILISDPLRSSGSKKGLKNRLASFLKDDFVKKEKNTYIVNNQDAQDIINFIVNSFFDSDENLKLTTEEQYQFWKKNFNIDKSEVESAKVEGRYKDITFIIIPELSGELEVVELINLRKKWLKKENFDIDQFSPKILGITNNFNGFSNYYGLIIKSLQEKDVAGILEAQKRLLPILDEGKVYDLLLKLSEKSELVGRPKMVNVNSWADYRSVFGGKLQSWFTNMQKREKELDLQIEKFSSDLKKSIEYLQNKNFKEAESEKEEIISLLLRLQEFFTDDSKSIKSNENYEVFESILSSVKRSLNFFYQKYVKEEADETKVNKFEHFKGIYERIYKPVSFFGESSRRRNKKTVEDTIPILEDGIENIKTIIKEVVVDFSPESLFADVKMKNEKEEDVLRKFLQFIWNKYKTQSINSKDFQDFYESLLKEKTAKDFWENLKKKENKDVYVFYQSPYSKGTLKKIEILVDDYLSSFTQTIKIISEKLLSYDKSDLFKDSGLLLDWIELSKNITSILIRFNQKDSFFLEKIKLERFEKAKNYKKLFSLGKASKNEFSFFVQSFIFSEIRGAATVYSKKEYKSSYTVQVIGSDGKFNLFYKFKDGASIKKEILYTNPSDNLRKELMKSPHIYLVRLDKTKDKRKNDSYNAILLGKKSIKLASLEEARNGLFRLTSSPYQLQFLDKYLFRPRGWEDININLREWSFTVEKVHKIEWDLNEKKPLLKPILEGKSARKNKLYISIPFNLSPKENAKETYKLEKISTKKDSDRLNYPILGVDVGEYGLAYCLTKFDYDKENYQIKDIEILDLGFIEDKNIGNIKDRFSEIQQKSRQGEFDEDDTTVSRVRENALGALRNKIHFVVTKNGSSVVYEDAISNFETGSGRTTKIYNSVKRADTEFESEADKQIHNHIWGENAKYIGRNLGAYASSYICINCLQSVYSFRKDDLGKAVITKREGNIVTIKVNQTEVKGYTNKKEYKEGYAFKATEEDFKSFKKMIQDFARPPISENSEVLEKYAKHLINGSRIKGFRKKRGNSAIFVCPFCGFVTDADIQAAFMMSVRGYLRFSGIVESSDSKKQNKEEKKEKTGESFLRKTLEYLNKPNIKAKIAEKLKII
jgi:hypothetical protein